MRTSDKSMRFERKHVVVTGRAALPPSSQRAAREAGGRTGTMEGDAASGNGAAHRRRSRCSRRAASCESGRSWGRFAGRSRDTYPVHARAGTIPILSDHSSARGERFPMRVEARGLTPRDALITFASICIPEWQSRAGAECSRRSESRRVRKNRGWQSCNADGTTIALLSFDGRGLLRNA